MAKKPAKSPNSKPDSRSKSKRGGKRPGAGRPTSEAAKIRADFNAVANDKLIEWLPDLLTNMKRLADGGYERVEETFEQPEGMTISVAPGQEGTKPLPTELVCTKRVVSVAEPDRAANQYLIDRLLGKPTERKEVSGPEGGAIPVAFEDALAKVYGDDGGSECSA